jgi:hypothetical protein
MSLLKIEIASSVEIIATDTFSHCEARFGRVAFAKSVDSASAPPSSGLSSLRLSTRLLSTFLTATITSVRSMVLEGSPRTKLGMKCLRNSGWTPLKIANADLFVAHPGWCGGMVRPPFPVRRRLTFNQLISIPPCVRSVILFVGIATDSCRAVYFDDWEFFTFD